MDEAVRNGGAAQTAGATLLLVDDEPNVLAALRRLLRPHKYRILTAGGGAEGLEILAREPVDLVISDMRMPEMDGAEFLGQVADRWPETMRLLLTGYADLQSTVAAINQGHIYKYLSKPWEEHDLTINVQRALERKRLEEERRRLLETVRRQNDELREFNTNLERKVEARVAEIRQLMGMLEQSYADLKRSYREAVGVFSSIIEAHEPAVAGHARRVADLARRLALALGMEEEAAQEVEIAARLHDIGKVSLPDGLIQRPFDALTYSEREEVAKHPVIGEALLMSLQPLRDAARIVRSHHERYDGQGYPDGLRGEAIPLGARIVALASDYDDLRHGRLLLDCLDERQALDYLLERRGTHYDPRVVDAVAQCLGAAARAAERPAQVVTPEALRPGMRLARDMLTRSGMILLAEGHVLDEHLIAKIQALARTTGANIRICVRPQ